MATPMRDEPLERLAAIREEIARLQRERQVLATAPLPTEEADRNIDAWLRHLRGEVADDSIRHFAHPRFDPRSGLKPAHFDRIESALAWIAADRIRRELKRALADYLRDHPPGPPREERKRKMAEVDRELESLEVEEEALIEELEAVGVEVDRRADASPEAVLGLARSRRKEVTD